LNFIGYVDLDKEELGFISEDAVEINVGPSYSYGIFIYICKKKIKHFRLSELILSVPYDTQFVKLQFEFRRGAASI
jgi:hypothetical protein